MQTTCFDWSEIHLNGTLWFEHLKLRKRVFVDGACWDVPHTDDVEWDQFDTPKTKYFVTHQDGNIIASSRAMPCNFTTPNASYMIRDACDGRLPGIPSEILADPPHSPLYWEATRFAANPDASNSIKLAGMRENARSLLVHCQSFGARSVIALMPPGFVAWFQRAGINATRRGPVVRNKDQEKFCVIQVDTPFLTDMDQRLSA